MRMVYIVTICLQAIAPALEGRFLEQDSSTAKVDWRAHFDAVTSADSNTSHAARDYFFSHLAQRLNSESIPALSADLKEIVQILITSQDDNKRIQASGVILGTTELRTDASKAIQAIATDLLTQVDGGPERARFNVISTFSYASPDIPDAAKALLMRKAKDPNRQVARGAVLGVGRLAKLNTDAEQIIIDLLNSRGGSINPQETTQVVSVCGLSGSRVVAALAADLKDSSLDEPTKLTVIKTLGRLGVATQDVSKAALNEVAADSSSPVLSKAAQAMLGGK